MVMVLSRMGMAKRTGCANDLHAPRNTIPLFGEVYRRSQVYRRSLARSIGVVRIFAFAGVVPF